MSGIFYEKQMILAESSSSEVSSSSSLGEYWNPNIKYGTLTDERDGGKTYRTIVIGTQVWMAENLNFATESGSWCYEEKEENCDIYGRLYDWETANAVCPTGWHLPSSTEWTTLTNYIGDSSTAGTKLKAKSGWNSSSSGSGNGTDDYGFSALPGGLGNSDGSFGSVGNNGYWWSATENGASDAYHRYMYYSYEFVNRNYVGKDYLFSVRCVKN